MDSWLDFFRTEESLRSSTFGWRTSLSHEFVIGPPFINIELVDEEEEFLLEALQEKDTRLEDQTLQS